jgi:hypothetical protein
VIASDRDDDVRCEEQHVAWDVGSPQRPTGLDCSLAVLHAPTSN